MWIKRAICQGLGILALASTNSRATGSPLDAYLLLAKDLPAECHSVTGTFPAGPKIATLYQYSAYQSVLPKLSDRHAQSFNCGGQDGSIFYFQYATAADKDSAALFSKPVLSKEAAGWVDWSTGFAVVSFKDPPASLMSAVRKKAKGRGTVTAAAPTTLSQVIASTTSMGSGSQTPIGTVADISDIALDTLIGSVGCESATTSETKKVCAWLNDFKTGRKPGSSIPPDTPVLGQAYRIDSYGRLEEKFIDVLIGNGQPGGLMLLGIQPASALEDYEGQSVVEARQSGKPLPANSISSRILKQPRPTSVGVVEAGTSWAMNSEGVEKRSFLRKQKDGRWIALSVVGDSPDEQTRSSFVIAALY